MNLLHKPRQVIIAVILFVYAGVQVYCIHQLSANYDEGLFASYGVSLLKGQPAKDMTKYDSQLPITAVNMLPRAFEQLVRPGLHRTDGLADLIHGRYVSLVITLLLALLVCRFSSDLYGPDAGMFSLILFLLCPNFLAHGIFLSPDIFACLFTTATIFFLWRFNRAGSRKDFLFFSLSIALAQVTKFSMIHLVPISVIALVVIYFRKRKLQPSLFNGKRILILYLQFILVNWLVIAVAHLFYGLAIPLNQFQFHSSFFQHLQQLFHGIGDWFFIPMPSAYLKGLDMVMYLDHQGGGRPGSTIGPMYLLGRSSADGFWYYYFVVLFYKLPIPVLCFLLFTLFAFYKGHARQQPDNEFFLWMPVLYYLIYMDFFYSTQIGIRHIMIILPLLYVLAGLFFSSFAARQWRYITAILVGWQLVSVMGYFPHFLPYTNEFIPDKKMVYQKIADTNICYGEGQLFLSAYLRKHPGTVYLPQQFLRGKFVIEINELLNLDFNSMHRYDWARSLQPADHIASQYLIYDLAADSVRTLNRKP